MHRILEFEEFIWIAVLCLALYRTMSGNQLAAYSYHHRIVDVITYLRLNSELQNYISAVARLTK